MIDSDAERFGNELEARWQNTREAACALAWEKCKAFPIDVVVRAMNKLRAAMKSDLQIVDAERLGAVCRGIEGDGATEDTPAARRTAAEQQAEANRKRLESERMVAAADFARLDREIADKAELRAKAEKNCAERLCHAWPRFNEASRKRLVDIELAGMK